MPFTLRDEDIPDDWSCTHNIWDKAHASCTVPQELTDEEIDNILAAQGVQARAGRPTALSGLRLVLCLRRRCLPLSA